MKFRFIIISFNIIIVFFLLVIGFTPYAILGADIAQKFWSTGWPFAAILFLAMIGLNVFFFMNNRLFMLLEKEDWPALVEYLERRIYERGDFSSRIVKLLANSYIIMSDSMGVMRLEKKVAQTKPALLESNALVFGAARILDGDLAGAAAFFNTRLEKGKVKNVQWVRWYYGFSLLLSRDFAKSENEFRTLALASDDAIVTGLSAWFLIDTLLKFSANPDQCKAAAEEGRNRLRISLKKPDTWHKETAKLASEVHTAVIRKYIDESSAWLFQKEE